MLEAHILASLVDSGWSLLCVSFPRASQIKSSTTSHMHRGPEAAETQFGNILSVNSALTCCMRALTSSRIALSMDSGRGKDLFKFDRSLMERLADNGFPMSQINVQRRMRPTISHHIRYCPLSTGETLSLRNSSAERSCTRSWRITKL